MTHWLGLRRPRAHAALRGDGRVRVVFCLDNFGIGGSELNAVRLAEHLDKSRFRLSVAALRASGPLMERFAKAGVPVHVFPVRSLYGASALHEGLRFARFLAEEGADVVHSHDIYNNLFATVWARVARVPAVIASRRWWHTLNRPGHRMACAVGYRLADRVLANCEAVAASLVQDEHIPADRVVVVPNFVDASAFEPLSRSTREQLLAAFGVPGDALLVGVVARLAPIKDHASLIRAIGTLAPRWPRLHLVVVGRGVAREGLGRLVAELGLTGRVHFVGLQPQKPNLHALFDLSVLPSRSEGFPNVVLEAMAAATPVVATAVGGTRDAVISGETGLLVPPGDTQALAIAIESLLGDPARRTSMGTAAQQRARRFYQASCVVPALEDLYESLARAGRG
jgi:glycosyltransferase involved in cell wall biosynthesis